MARSKMELVLEELAHVFTDETTAAMTGPYSTPLGKAAEGTIDSTATPKVDDPEGTAPLGKGRPEPGGDISFYTPEQKKSDFPYAKPGKTTEADGDIPKIPDPEGKPVLGKGTPEKGGDPSHYGDEKTDSKYPFKFDEKKPGVKTETDDPLAELEKLQKLAEEEPIGAEPAADMPAAEPEGEPTEVPEEIEWEIYLHSGDFDLISDRATEVLKPIVGDPKVAITVKFFGDEGKKNSVIDALTASGFVVLDVEKEGESDGDEDEVISAPAPDVTGAAPENPEAAAGPEIMAEAKRKNWKKKQRSKR